ncbi:cytochrome P450 [Maribacter sp. MJ134]|uniref:cytochrome P450 n=1 Tax=Maribacter sp. MJ134 TaxID=2496865 RepID=UPI000F824DE4|nr:cytochrome P450 [Maribacter sp. MJ134]AZQ57835.1 cytochrome P450 [Maribacter sp. MJ134]
MDESVFKDPFKTARIEEGIGHMTDQNEKVKMILRLKDLRKTAHNWKTFQSGGKEIGRIVVPSEEKIRKTRQIPFEVDPPEHGQYRELLEAWFKRPLDSEYEEKLRVQIATIIDSVIKKDRVEIVSELALLLQSRALTLLLNIPLEESEVWINWGTHVFRSEDTALDKDKANILYDYIDHQIDKAIANPGEDLYSVLLDADFQGRKLNKEEIKGVMILIFAGGRDTVINAITNTIAYFAEHPEALRRLNEEPDVIGKAVEEFIRYFSPLTHMGRVTTEDTQICEHAVKANSKVSLCWASANRDETVFEKPNDILLDRKMNPHVGFGFGHHKCLGATHARQLLKILISVLVQKIDNIQILDYKENIEDLEQFERKVGFDNIHVKFNSIQ